MLETPIIVDTWIDFARPECYLALTALRRAVGRLPFKQDIVIAVRPFLQTQPADRTVAEGLSEAAGKNQGPRLSRGQLDEVAAQLGIRIDWDAPLPTGTLAAQQLVLYAHQEQELSGQLTGAETLSLRLAQAVMRTLFEMGGNIESPEVLIGVAQDLKIPGEVAATAIANPILTEEVEGAFQLALHLGVQSPPVFLFDETFVAEGFHSVEAFEKILATVWEKRAAVREEQGE